MESKSTDLPQTLLEKLNGITAFFLTQRFVEPPYLLHTPYDLGVREIQTPSGVIEVRYDPALQEGALWVTPNERYLYEVPPL